MPANLTTKFSKPSRDSQWRTINEDKVNMEALNLAILASEYDAENNIYRTTLDEILLDTDHSVFSAQGELEGA